MNTADMKGGQKLICGSNDSQPNFPGIFQNPQNRGRDCDRRVQLQQCSGNWISSRTKHITRYAHTHYSSTLAVAVMHAYRILNALQLFAKTTTPHTSSSRCLPSRPDITSEWRLSSYLYCIQHFHSFSCSSDTNFKLLFCTHSVPQSRPSFLWKIWKRHEQVCLVYLLYLLCFSIKSWLIFYPNSQPHISWFLHI